MNRRAFLTWVGVGWVASSLPIAIAACSAQTTESSQATQPQSAPSDGYQSVGTVAELAHTGLLLNKTSPARPVLVVREAGSNVIAVNPSCPHKGCTVAWRAEPKKFHCPCHGAEFGLDGQVLEGPATKPLKTYAVKIAGNSILVKES